jgi:hypothetical protein
MDDVPSFSFEVSGIWAQVPLNTGERTYGAWPYLAPVAQLAGGSGFKTRTV